MSLMISSIKDSDGQYILASCPFYHENPLCVNSCACFVPFKIETEEGVLEEDYSAGWCGIPAGRPQLLTALTEKQEQQIRNKRGWGKRHA